MLKCPVLMRALEKRGGQMRVSQPTEMMFYISVALAIISVVLHVMAYMEIDIFPTTGYLVA